MPKNRKPHPTPTPTPTPTPAPPPAGTYDVPAAIPSDGRAVEAQLASWVGSLPPGAVARLRPGTFGCEDSLVLHGPNGLRLDLNGGTLAAVGYGHAHRAVIRAQSFSGLTVANGTVRGANNAGPFANYAGDQEWQHGISLESMDGAVLDRVNVRNVWGDFVYVGHHNNTPNHSLWVPSRNVRIQGGTYDTCGRMGMGFVHCEDVLVTVGSDGTRPMLTNVNQAPFDVEQDSDEVSDGMSGIPPEGRINQVGRRIVIAHADIGTHRFSILANGGASWYPYVGQITLDDVTELDVPSPFFGYPVPYSGEPPLQSVPPWYAQATYREWFTVKNSRLFTRTALAILTNVRNFLLADNLVVYREGGLGHPKVIAELRNCHDGRILRNRMPGGTGAVLADAACTNITVGTGPDVNTFV